MSDPGKITWHSSEDDGGPDCGIELSLGNGRSLYAGETAGAECWQFAVVDGDSIIPFANVFDQAQVIDLIERMARAITAPALR